MESIIQKNNFLNFMINMGNTKNDWFYCINENLEYYAFNIDLSIAQNSLNCTKSYKKDKMEKKIFWENS